MQACQRLDDYLDGDLSTESILSFEAHLKECEACRLAVDDYQQLAQDMRMGFDSLEMPSPSRRAQEEIAESASLHAQDTISNDGKPDDAKVSQPTRRLNSNNVQLAWIAIATVAVLAITIGSIAWVQRNSSSSGKGDMAGNSPSLPTHGSEIDANRNSATDGMGPLDPPPVVEVKMRGDSLVVPVASEEDFTIVRVYQTRRAPSQIDDVENESTREDGDRVDEHVGDQGLDTEESTNQ